MGKDVAVGVSQLYFDGTFIRPSTGIESGYIASLNLRSAAKFQQESVKMIALIPTYDKDAATQTLSKEDIKKREMEVYQAFIGLIVRMQNMYSKMGGFVDVLCPDGNVYSMLVIMLCLALDHEDTLPQGSKRLSVMCLP